jgi:hypothetical protein
MPIITGARNWTRAINIAIIIMITTIATIVEPIPTYMKSLLMVLTIAFDTSTFGDCTVYADWNDLQPMQKATPAGMNYTEQGRTNDYSKWLFTYTDKYQVIS